MFTVSRVLCNPLKCCTGLLESGVVVPLWTELMVFAVSVLAPEV